MKKPFAWVSRVWDQLCASWGSKLPTLPCSAQIRCGAQPGATIVCFKKTTPPNDNDGQDKHLQAPVLCRVLNALVHYVSPKGNAGGGMRVLGVGTAAGR